MGNGQYVNVFLTLADGGGAQPMRECLDIARALKYTFGQARRGGQAAPG